MPRPTMVSLLLPPEDVRRVIEALQVREEALTTFIRQDAGFGIKVLREERARTAGLRMLVQSNLAAFQIGG